MADSRNDNVEKPKNPSSKPNSPSLPFAWPRKTPVYPSHSPVPFRTIITNTSTPFTPPPLIIPSPLLLPRPYQALSIPHFDLDFLLRFPGVCQQGRGILDVDAGEEVVDFALEGGEVGFHCCGGGFASVREVRWGCSWWFGMGGVYERMVGEGLWVKGRGEREEGRVAVRGEQ